MSIRNPYNNKKNKKIKISKKIIQLKLTQQSLELALKNMTKHILVTGGNSGIGLALCKLLIKDHSCYVYLGSRDAGRGTAAMKSILEEVPDKVTICTYVLYLI